MRARALVAIPASRRLLASADPGEPAPAAASRLVQTPVGAIWLPAESERTKHLDPITCVHEAGHAVAARVLRIPHGAVNVIGGVDEDGTGWHGRINGTSSTGPAPRHEDELLYFLAGPVAEAKCRAVPIAERLHGRDARRVKDLAVLATATVAEAELLIPYAKERARTMIWSHWYAVQALAQALVSSDGDLSYREVARVLREAGLRRT